MSGSNAICLCGHYCDSHVECIDDACTVSGWHVTCTRCDCHEYRADYEMERALREEAEERKYQEWKDRT